MELDPLSNTGSLISCRHYRRLFTSKRWMFCIYTESRIFFTKQSKCNFLYSVTNTIRAIFLPLDRGRNLLLFGLYYLDYLLHSYLLSIFSAHFSFNSAQSFWDLMGIFMCIGLYPQENAWKLSPYGEKLSTFKGASYIKLILQQQKQSLTPAIWTLNER